MMSSFLQHRFHEDTPKFDGRRMVSRSMTLAATMVCFVNGQRQQRSSIKADDLLTIGKFLVRISHLYLLVRRGIHSQR